MSCRHAEPARVTAPVKNTDAAKDRTRFSVRNGGHLSRTQCLEELARRRELELWIPRLDAQEEPVPAGQRESRYVEHRVVRLRQAVEREHAEHGRQRGD